MPKNMVMHQSTQPTRHKVNRAAVSASVGAIIKPYGDVPTGHQIVFNTGFSVQSICQVFGSLSELFGEILEDRLKSALDLAVANDDDIIFAFNDFASEYAAFFHELRLERCENFAIYFVNSLDEINQVREQALYLLALALLRPGLIISSRSALLLIKAIRQPAL